MPSRIRALSSFSRPQEEPQPDSRVVALRGFLVFGIKRHLDAMDRSTPIPEEDSNPQRESWLLFRGLMIVAVVAVAAFALAVAYRPDWLLAPFTH
jgi:hypothetical protein